MSRIFFYFLLFLSTCIQLNAQIRLPALSENSKNLIPYRVKDKWGYADRTNKKIKICVEYDEARFFYKDRAWVKKDNLYGCIDTNGILLIPFKYTQVNDTELDGCYGKEFGSTKWIGIPIYGKEWFRLPALPREEFEAGLVIKDGKYGFKNDNNLILNYEYDTIIYQNPWLGVFLVRKNGKWGELINQNKFTIPIVYDSIKLNPPHNIFGIIVKQGNHWGVQKYYCNLIPIQYDNINSIHKHRFCVKYANKWGVVDDGNVMLIDYQYQNIIDTDNPKHRYIAQQNNKWGILSEQNEWVLQPGFDSIYYLNGPNAFILKKNNLLGVYFEGQDPAQVSYKYRSVKPIWGSYFFSRFLNVTTKEGRMGYIDLEGQEFFEE